MKRRTFTRTAVAAFLFAAIPLSAANGITASPTVSSLTAAAQATRLANLKTRGTAEIDRRLANLNAALTKLTAGAKQTNDGLVATPKTAFTKQIQDEITALTALKTKLAADADLATARVDVQSIVTDYRVYVLMLPKARMTASADRFAVVEAKLAALDATLQTKVNAQKAAGHDVTAMQASLDDLKAKTADATSKTSTLAAQLLAIQPTDYNANHAVLVTYRAALATAQTDVKAARDDAKSVIDALAAAK